MKFAIVLTLCCVTLSVCSQLPSPRTVEIDTYRKFSASIYKFTDSAAGYTYPAANANWNFFDNGKISTDINCWHGSRYTMLNLSVYFYRKVAGWWFLSLNPLSPDEFNPRITVGIFVE